MSQKVEHFMDYLVIHRKIVLAVLAGILALSLLAGFLYQSRIEKEQEARFLYDNAAANIRAVVNDLQQQENQVYAPDAPTLPQARQAYRDGINNLDTLIFEYSDTVPAVRAALLGMTLVNITNLNVLLEDPTIMENFRDQTVLREMQNKFPVFWGAALALAEGVQAEQTLQYDEAIRQYESALDLDRKKFISDYALVSIARVYEVLNNPESASEYYQRVADEFPDSEWLSFAMGKVYLISQQQTDNTSTQMTN